MNHHYLDACPLDISDEDILKAMKDMMGYLDITPGDFKEIYNFAYEHAAKRLTHTVTAGDVMTRKVIYVNHKTPLEDVADMMHRHLISGIPVIGDDKIVAGVISEKDFLFHMGAGEERTFMGVVSHCLKNKGCVAISLRNQKAQDIMTSPAITVTASKPVFEIARTFTEKNINRMPVVDQDNGLIGIVTRTDIVRSSCAIRT